MTYVARVQRMEFDLVKADARLRELDLEVFTQAATITELQRLLEQARSIACTLEAECAACPDPIHVNPTQVTE